MGGGCPAGQFWDILVRGCVQCDVVCQRVHVIRSCSSYCASARCRLMPAHYYDGLLRRCLNCSEVCGRHPAECSRHCRPPSSPETSGSFLVKATSRTGAGRSTLMAPDDSSVLVGLLLALCMLLLLSSLFLALAVFLRGGRTRTKPGAKAATSNQDIGVKLGQEAGWKCGQEGQSSTGRPDCESHDPSPTETCACVHCFLHLAAGSPDADRPPTAPQYRDHQQAWVQEGGLDWTKRSILTYGAQERNEAAEG